MYHTMRQYAFVWSSKQLANNAHQFTAVPHDLFTPSSIGVRPNAENQNLEISNLGVLGTPGHRTPVGKKIWNPIFRGIRKTRWLEVCMKTQWTKILSPTFRGLRKTGTPDTEKIKNSGCSFYPVFPRPKMTWHLETNRAGCKQIPKIHNPPKQLN